MYSIVAFWVVTITTGVLIFSPELFAKPPVTKIVITRKLVTTTEIVKGKIVKSETKWYIEAKCTTGNHSSLTTLTEDEYVRLYFDDIHKNEDSGIAPVVNGTSKIVSTPNSSVITDEMTISTTIYGECR